MANMSTIEHHGQLFSLVAPEQITNPALKSAKPIRILMTIWRKSPYFSRGMDSPK